jgi:pimeloyl-ACP methyl ester carboxylesterase
MNRDLAEQKSNTPKLRHLLAEGRTVLEFGLTSMALPLLMGAPRGDDHPVMVLPGFMASDISTKPIRSFLKLKGYQSVGWGLGRNLGTEIVGGQNVISDRLINQIIRLSVRHDKKVSLVGWSLGGILAREVARVIPDHVRQVISLGSPFNGPFGSAPVASRFFKLFNGDIGSREPEALLRMLLPPPVPSSAIFSRTDGIAHWQACKDNHECLISQTENIEVKGSHTGLGHNPQVIWIVANRLAQPEGQWQPFLHKKLHRTFYPDPNRA